MKTYGEHDAVVSMRVLGVILAMAFLFSLLAIR